MSVIWPGMGARGPRGRREKGTDAGPERATGCTMRDRVVAGVTMHGGVLCIGMAAGEVTTRCRPNLAMPRRPPPSPCLLRLPILT